jgi:hypothetical protein
VREAETATHVGQGFTSSQRISDLAAVGLYGLMGVQERAGLIGAWLSIRSAPGQGPTVELRLPLWSSAATTDPPARVGFLFLQAKWRVAQRAIWR